jgi:hypothetical protein
MSFTLENETETKGYGRFYLYSIVELKAVTILFIVLLFIRSYRDEICGGPHFNKYLFNRMERNAAYFIFFKIALIIKITQNATDME